MARILVWFWARGGGGSQFAANLAHRLTLEFGSDAVALSMRSDDPSALSAEARGVEVLRADVVSDRLRPLTTLSQIARGAAILKDHARSADVVVVAMNFAMAAPLSLTLDKPIVYCAHDPTPHIGDYAQLGQRFGQAGMFARASIVVALSKYCATLLAKRVAVSKLRLAPLNSVFEPQVSNERLSGGLVRLLMPGRMIAYKGLDLLADALAPLAGRRDWRLSIAGMGPALSGELEKRLSLPQLGEVRRDFVSEADMRAMFCASDVVLAPYRAASQSGVVAEALAFGKPCVVTPVGALSEQIDGGAAGWVSKSVTPEAYSAALKEMLDSPDRRAEKADGARRLAQSAWQSDYWSWLVKVGA